MSDSQISVALIGANGMLAQAVVAEAPECYQFTNFDLPEFDLTDEMSVHRALGDLQPNVIINCAAYTQVDKAEGNEEIAMRVNGNGPGCLAAAAKKVGAVLVHISTDYVFDGKKTSPYLETDAVCPQSAYGRTKLAGERSVFESGLGEFYILRTSWLYGPGGPNFVETMLRLASERDELRVVDDQRGTPTYTRDLAQAIFSLLRCGPTPRIEASSGFGLYHFSNSGECSWCDFAREIINTAKRRGIDLAVKKLTPIATEEYPLPAKRPAYSVFSKDKFMRQTGLMVRSWEAALVDYFDQRQS